MKNYNCRSMNQNISKQVEDLTYQGPEPREKGKYYIHFKWKRSKGQEDLSSGLVLGRLYTPRKDLIYIESGKYFKESSYKYSHNN